MAEIKSGNRVGANPLGDRHDDRIDQSQTERPILLADRVGANDVFLLAVFHHERAFCDVGAGTPPAPAHPSSELTR